MTDQQAACFVALVLGIVGGAMIHDVQRAWPMDTDQTRSDTCYPGHMTACKRVAQNLGLTGIGTSGAQGRFESGAIVVNGITYYPRPCGQKEQN